MGPDLLRKHKPTLSIPRESYAHLKSEHDRWRALATERAIKITELEALLRQRAKPHTW